MLRETISFENVSFHYGSHGSNVLEGLDLKISKGSRVGIIGRTGSGKSTALDLLMCLFEPTRGQILVDGHLLIMIESGHAGLWRMFHKAFS